MKYWQFVLIVLLIAMLGYLAYAIYPRFEIASASISLYLLAIAAGFASFFSPCSFSLMAGLLARESRAGNTDTTSIRFQRSFTFALSLAVGALLFFIIASTGLVLGGSVLYASITFTSIAGRVIRTITGLILILLGLVQLSVLPNPLSFVTNISAPLLRYQARTRRQQPALGFAILGFAYPMAGFG